MTPEQRQRQKMMVFAGMGFELVVLVVGAAYLGAMIDEAQGWSGTAMTSLILIGLVGWLVHIVVLAQALDRQEGRGQQDE